MHLAIILTGIFYVISLGHCQAQEITIDLKEQNLTSAIKELRRQAKGYDFAFNSKILRNTKPVTVKLSRSTLTKALEEIFKGQPLQYQIKDKTIYLYDKPTEKKISETKSLAPPQSIRGTVTDSLGTPLSGVTVRIRGKNITGITDSNGKFELSGATIDDEITFLFIGFKQVTFPVKENLVNVRLTPSENRLQTAIVINTGYQSIPKERATGSFVLIDSAIINRRVSTNILDRLEGMVPGLLFNKNTAASTGGPDINVRGRSTLYAGDQPLIVLDGFPYDGDISNINPIDIENISVLKDAAAASIWGVRSGNGVIVLTTRKGKKNTGPSVGFSTTITLGEKPDVFYNPNFIASRDLISVEKGLFDKDFYSASINDPLQVITPVVQALYHNKEGTLSNSGLNKTLDSLGNLDIRNEIKRYYYRNPILRQHAINFSGGADHYTYRFSIGHDKNEQELARNENRRTTISLANTFNLASNLEVQSDILFANATRQTNNTLSDLHTGGSRNSIYPYVALRDLAGNATKMERDYNSSFLDLTKGSSKYRDWSFYPLNELENADNKVNNVDARIVLGLKYKIFDGLNLQLNYQYEKQITEADNYFLESSYYTRNLYNMFLDTSSGNTPVPDGGILQKQYTNLISKRLRTLLSFNKNLKGIHDINILIGAEGNDSRTSGNSSTAYGYDKNTGSQVNVDFRNYYEIYPAGTNALIPNNNSFSGFTDRYISYFGNAGYIFKKKYIFSISGRIDKSNLFGVNVNQQSVPLYSTGFAWDISKESFYHFDLVPYLKLRATYGYNGNVDKTVAAVTTILQRNNAYITGLPFAQILNPNNPELRWEKTNITNIGIDFSSKSDLISGSIEYYKKRGLDLIGYSPLASSTGIRLFKGNTASTKGEGLDLLLTFKVLKSKVFRWNSTINYSYSLDKVVKYDVEATSSDYLLYGSGNGGSITPFEGKPIFSIYSYKSAGLDHDKGNPQGYLDGELSTDYVGIISKTGLNDLEYIGPSRPTSFGSFLNTFSYKSLSFSFNIQYKLGFYFRRSSLDYGALYYNLQGHKDYDTRWQKPGDEMITTVPSSPDFPLDPSRNTFYMLSQSLISKGDHIRLQDINISYKLPIGKLFSNRIKDPQIYFYANNLGILWRANKFSLDPDTFAGGLPVARTYALGLKCSL